jgi:hypothetical protein
MTDYKITDLANGIINTLGKENGGTNYNNHVEELVHNYNNNGSYLWTYLNTFVPNTYRLVLFQNDVVGSYNPNDFLYIKYEDLEYPVISFNSIEGTTEPLKIKDLIGKYVWLFYSEGNGFAIVGGVGNSQAPVNIIQTGTSNTAINNRDKAVDGILNPIELYDEIKVFFTNGISDGSSANTIRILVGEDVYNCYLDGTHPLTMKNVVKYNFIDSEPIYFRKNGTNKLLVLNATLALDENGNFDSSYGTLGTDTSTLDGILVGDGTSLIKAKTAYELNIPTYDTSGMATRLFNSIPYDTVYLVASEELYEPVKYYLNGYGVNEDLDSQFNVEIVLGNHKEKGYFTDETSTRVYLGKVVISGTIRFAFKIEATVNSGHIRLNAYNFKNKDIPGFAQSSLTDTEPTTASGWTEITGILQTEASGITEEQLDDATDLAIGETYGN